MKKSLRFIALSMATISLLASCGKEMHENQITTEPVESEEGYVKITFSAEYPALEVESKSTIAEDGSVAWNAGDEITLYYMEGGLPAYASATAITSGASAEFAASIPEGIDAVYAVYPAGKGTLTTDGTFKLNTASTQNGSFEQANFAVAWSKVAANMNLTFKNAVGLFKVRIPENGIIINGNENHTIKAISVCGKKTALAFAGDVTVSVGENGELLLSEPENPVNQTTIELDDKARKEGYVYIHSLPVNSEDGLAFNIQNTNGEYLPAAVTVDDKAITLERGHLKPVEAACESVVFDWYFTENGTGNGKSQDTPGNASAFSKLLNETKYLYGERRLNGATIHLADGTYALNERLDIYGTEAGNYTIEGTSLEGTIIDGQEQVQLIYWSGAKSLKMANLTLQNGKTVNNTDSDRGAAINSESSTGKLTMDNCKLYHNVTGKANSGAILLATDADFNKCIFESNNSKKTGAAFAVPGGTNNTIKINECQFLSNETGAANGGAIFYAGVGNIFVNRSVFKGNRVTVTSAVEGGVAIHCNVADSKLSVYNCTFNDNSAGSNSAPEISAVSYIIANSTFVAGAKRSSYGVICNRAAEDNISTLVNNIVIHGSGTASHVALGFKDEANICLTSGYNLVKGIKAKFTGALADNTTYSGSDVIKETFGFDSITENSYPWDGNTDGFILADSKSFSKCSLDQIKTLVKANKNGEAFWAWLESIEVNGTKATDVDIRGVVRTTTSMWPGSYQQD